MENKDLFESMPVRKAAMKMATPLMFSMLVTVIYNMADTFFIGQTGDANQVAAVSLTAPVFMLLMALGNIFGMGGSTYISRSLGKQDVEKAKHISSFAFYSTFAVGCVAMVGLLVMMNPLVGILGSSSETVGFCKDYLGWYVLGAPFVLCSFTLSNIVRSEGASKQAMIGNILGSVINIILDPIMILGLGLGVTGAAIATVIGNIVAVIYFVTYIMRKSQVLSVSIRDWKMDKDILKGIMVIGIPVSINNILMSIAYLFVNNYLKAYGDSAIGAMGIANKVVSLVILLLIGFTAGIQPLLGYAFGAKNEARLQALIKFASYCVVLGGLVGGVLIYILAEPIIHIFIDDLEVRYYGTMMLRALIISTPVVGISFILSSLFQAMGKGVQSMVLALARQGFIFIPIISIMSYTVGLNGIIYAQAITDVATTLIAVLMWLGLKQRGQLMKVEEVEV